jgi:ribonuclease HI
VKSLVVYVDGGCAANGRPGAQAYCSVRLGDAEPLRITLPEASTNNQAEYGALLCALELLAAQGQRGPVTIYTDSRLLVEQMAGRWRINDGRLRQLQEQVTALLREVVFEVRLLWVSRVVIVEKLGH